MLKQENNCWYLDLVTCLSANLIEISEDKYFCKILLLKHPAGLPCFVPGPHLPNNCLKCREFHLHCVSVVCFNINIRGNKSILKRQQIHPSWATNPFCKACLMVMTVMIMIIMTMMLMMM